MLARMILAQRGIEYTSEELEDLKNKRLEQLREPKTGDPLYLGLAYAVAFVISFPGIIWGLGYYATKVTLPNGERAMAYTEHTRKHGLYIAISGTVSFIFWCVAWWLDAIAFWTGAPLF